MLLNAKRALAKVETMEQLAEAKRCRVRVAFETMERGKTWAKYAIGDPQRVELDIPKVYWYRGS